MHPLAGIYAAALTPLTHEDAPDLEAFPDLLIFLAERGCHGALILGTTGEGPSFSPAERLAIYRAAAQVRQTYPHFRLLAGTGTPSWTETADLSRAAFDLGFDGVVVLPPYYIRTAPEDGLFAWFQRVITRAVPADGYLLAYHIPQVSGVGFSLDLLARLKDAFPQRFAGLKDSTGAPEHARALGERFGTDLLALTGNDRLLTHALQHHAGGCITALANLCSPDSRRVWDSFQAGQPDSEAQQRLNAARADLDANPPAPAYLKRRLHQKYHFPLWPVRPPLVG
ncbi:MAG: dihydrodipicolinate synthase family protein [Anaerolineales bacterium]